LKEIADREITPLGKVKSLDSFQVSSLDISHFCVKSRDYDFPLTGAKVTENWSIEFIENFCRDLDRNKYGKHAPLFSLKHLRIGSNDSVYTGQKEGYMCTLKFPRILELPDVQSHRLHTKEPKAKQDAAIQGVKVLYEKGFLNVHLKPYWLAKVEKSKVILQDPEVELVDEKGIRLRAKKKYDDKKHTTLLPQHICLYNVKGNPNTEYFIYAVETEPVFPKDARHFMGVLAPCLLELYSFNLFPFNNFRYSGVDLHRDFHPDCRNCQKFPFKVNIKVLFSVKLSEEKLEKLKLFHMIINSICKGQYSNLIKAFTNSPSLFKADEVPVMFIPLLESKIDFDLVEEVNKYFKNDVKAIKQPLHCPKPGDLLKSSHIREFFLYLRTVPDGLSFEFEDKHLITSVGNYFKSKYNMTFTSKDSVEVKSIGGFKQAIRARVVVDKHQDTLMIPLELAESFPLPPELILWCKLSPNIFHKMNQSFLTISLKQILKINLPHRTLLEAITCGSALEGLDYQRLEILGDSVLKLIVSDYLFKSNPKDFEGMLTCKRTALTCNDFLFKKALELGIYKYMQAKVFTTKFWKPQGLEKILEDQESNSSDEESPEYIDQFGFEKILDEEGEVKIEYRKEFVELSHKQLADCIEALIGAVYVTGGLSSSSNFIKNSLGLISESAYRVGRITDAVNLNLNLGYQFKNPALLTEALTHSTAQKGFDYNRLEYLGDAIIDFFVLDYFYNKFPEAGPGSLSKMKAFVVSNRTFSFISHSLGLANHLIYSGVELKSDLAKFKENAERLLNPSKITQLQDSGMKVMADLFESITAAIYIDSGDINQAHEFVLKNLSSIISSISPENCIPHPHNRIFDYAQRHRKDLGSFRIERFRVKIKADIEFITKIYIQEKVVAEGRGTSKLDSSSSAVDAFFKKFSEI
jgi:dsRNA-specific ribonuclease